VGVSGNHPGINAVAQRLVKARSCDLSRSEKQREEGVGTGVLGKSYNHDGLDGQEPELLER
jgi:hypothetical protein